jgi:cysteine desulfuration protein SufE
MQTQVTDINQIQDVIIDEFDQFTSWTDRYEYLIDMGKSLTPLSEKYKTEAYLVKGCQSKVWLHGEIRDGRLFLEADSDAVITKGIIALLIRVFSGQTALDIVNADLYFIEAIGLQSHLSPTRSNGLKSMIQYIRSYAEHGIAIKSENGESASVQREKMIGVLKQVYDPEIPVDIWELGLIYDMDLDKNGKVNIRMTLTSPACPVAGSLPLEVQERLLSLDFVKDVNLELVWDPAWSKDRMSDEAKMALDMF